MFSLACELLTWLLTGSHVKAVPAKNIATLSFHSHLYSLEVNDVWTPPFSEAPFRCFSYNDGTSMADPNCHLEVMHTNTDSLNVYVQPTNYIDSNESFYVQFWSILQSCPSNCFGTNDNESLFKLIQKRTLTRLVEKWGSIGWISLFLLDLCFTPKDQTPCKSTLSLD